MMREKRLKKLTTMAVLTAFCVVLSITIHFPLIPAVSFCKYDPADIPLLICGFAFGPLAGIGVTAAAALIHGLFSSSGSGLYGILMQIIASGALVTCSSLVYKFHRNRKGAIIGITCGVLAMTAVMIPANLLITPYFMGTSVDVVIPLLPWIALFNFLKAFINGFITFLLYKKISGLIHHFNS